MHFPHYPIWCLCFLFFAAQLLVIFCYAQWPTPDSDGLSWRFGDRVSFWGTWNVETMIMIITCYNLSPSHKCHFVHKPFLFLYPINHIYRYNSPSCFIALPSREGGTRSEDPRLDAAPQRPQAVPLCHLENVCIQAFRWFRWGFSSKNHRRFWRSMSVGGMIYLWSYG